VAALVVVEVGAPGVDHAAGVAHDKIPHTGGLAHIGDADARRAGAVHHDADFGHRAAAEARVVEQA